MNILFLDAYFEPETIAYTHLEKDLLQGIIQKEDRVQVICPLPTRGVSDSIKKEYKRRRHEIIYGGKVEVWRFWAPQEVKNPIIRAIRYFWCNFKSYQIGIKEKNIDVVFSNSTPPTQGMLSVMVARRLSKKYKKKVPFIYNLQDVFPDSLVNTGMTKKGSLFWKIGRKIENYTYKNVDKIIVISKGFKNNIMEKGVPEEKIEVISNWIDIDAVQPINKDNNTLYEEFGISRDKYIVLYAGNFGAAQGADIILKVAERLKDETDIEFVIFGGGAYFEEAKAQAAALPNVIINGLLPQTRVSEVYSLGDVALICCKPGTGNAGMPSKTWSIMACNTPIIASFDTDSDLADVIRTSGAGQCVEPGNVEKLTEAILNEFNKKTIQLNLRGFVKRYASKEVCVSRYIDEISNAAMRKKE